ncbi:hypothetical protein EI28_06310 [Methanoculleus sp. MH98A]|nr:hypothetical protein EI28_06310 [Methanoculleus sp. MH98A]
MACTLSTAQNVAWRISMSAVLGFEESLISTRGTGHRQKELITGAEMIREDRARTDRRKAGMWPDQGKVIQEHPERDILNRVNL